MVGVGAALLMPIRSFWANDERRLDDGKGLHSPEFGRLAVSGHKLYRLWDIGCPAGVTFRAAWSSL